MEISQSIDNIRSLCQEMKKGGESIGLVPTMGYLHEGHVELIRLAKKVADKVIVSAFINTPQFGLNEQIHGYPQSPERDEELCREEGVDVLFRPDPSLLFPKHFSSFVVEEQLTKLLGGGSRQPLFRGYATMIVMLNNLVHPDYYVLGQRDMQQVAVAKKVIKDFLISAKVEVAPIVRTAEGLVRSAFSDRLEGSQLKEALMIYKALMKAKEMVNGGTRSVERVLAEVTHQFTNCLKLRINYIAIVDPETLQSQPEVIPGYSILTISVWVDQFRLNDNIIL